MEIVCVAGLSLGMTAVIAFFVGELPVRGMIQAIRQRWQEPLARRNLLVLLALCVAAAAYGYWLFGLGRDLLGFLLGGSYLASITPGDIKKHTIPDRTTLFFAAAFVLFVLSAGDQAGVMDAALGAVLGAVLLGLPHLVRRDDVGFGDVKTVAACGIIYGALGVVALLLRAFLAIFVYCVVQLLRKKVTFKSEMPFAPFLLLAALI